MSERITKECRTHGLAEHALYDRWRCLQCAAKKKAIHRHKMKAILVERKGGACRICGYNRYAGALEFHHLDRRTKDFGIADAGWMIGFDRLLQESEKCILVCANCHREIEAGLHCGVEELVDSPVSETGVL